MKKSKPKQKIPEEKYPESKLKIVGWFSDQEKKVLLMKAGPND
ncbi:MAG: hypothetical protein QXI27_04730 [Nitrososphaerota archaeon]